jgi:hypothetical protein
MDPFVYTYPSPLTGFENQQPLPEEKAEDGKSEHFLNNKTLSPSWTLSSITRQDEADSNQFPTQAIRILKPAF